jgi:hypothetical protein
MPLPTRAQLEKDAALALPSRTFPGVASPFAYPPPARQRARCCWRVGPHRRATTCVPVIHWTTPNTRHEGDRRARVLADVGHPSWYVVPYSGNNRLLNSVLWNYIPIIENIDRRIGLSSEFFQKGGAPSGSFRPSSRTGPPRAATSLSLSWRHQGAEVGNRSASRGSVAAAYVVTDQSQPMPSAPRESRCFKALRYTRRCGFEAHEARTATGSPHPECPRTTRREFLRLQRAP